jgi:hypothetical protein
MVVLPEPFGPNHAKRFPLVEMHDQIIDSQQRAEAFGDTTEFEDRAHSWLASKTRAQAEGGARAPYQFSSLSLS